MNPQPPLVFGIYSGYLPEPRRSLPKSGGSPGLTNVQRLTYLSILLQALGPAQRLNDVLEELQRAAAGKPISHAINEHVRVLRAEAGS
jgi:hypothetical protein